MRSWNSEESQRKLKKERKNLFKSYHSQKNSEVGNQDGMRNEITEKKKHPKHCMKKSLKVVPVPP